MQLRDKALPAAFLLLSAIFLADLAAASPDAPGIPPLDSVELSTLGEALPEERLARQDGRQDIQIDQLNTQTGDIKSNGTLSGNTLSALNSTVTTGMNTIGEAFTNASGIVTVIQNSGNQVLIQNDMILNLWVK